MTAFPKPADLIPHRAPFLLLDEITALEPGEKIQATWRLTGEEDFFAGHFPGRPTLPGVLMVESLAQAGACSVLSVPEFADKLPLFGGADKIKFRRQVVPGETLTLTVEMLSLRGRAGKGIGKAHVGTELACQAEILFILVDS